MDNLRGGHCWCRWRADGAVRRGDFGQIGYRDYTPSRSLAIEWVGGLYWLLPTVILSVLGGVLSAWLFLVEQV